MQEIIDHVMRLVEAARNVDEAQVAGTMSAVLTGLTGLLGLRWLRQRWALYRLDRRNKGRQAALAREHRGCLVRAFERARAEWYMDAYRRLVVEGPLLASSLDCLTVVQACSQLGEGLPAWASAGWEFCRVSDLCPETRAADLLKRGKYPPSLADAPRAHVFPVRTGKPDQGWSELSVFPGSPD